MRGNLGISDEIGTESESELSAVVGSLKSESYWNICGLGITSGGSPRSGDGCLR